MRVVVAGAHGQIARRLVRRLAERGDDVQGLVRNPDHVVDVLADGGRGVVVDLEAASVEEVEWALADADAVVFAAGAGPGSGVERKDSMDRAGAVLLAEAAERAGVRRFVLISSMGVEKVRSDDASEGLDEVFTAYLRAKLESEDDVRSRDLDWTVLRPGRLTDDPGGAELLMAERVPYGQVSRDDVADTVVRLLDDPSTSGQVLEIVEESRPSSASS